MEEHIMKIIIAGAGRIGTAVAADLSHEGHDITVIDKDPTVIAEVSNTLDVICFEGSAANPETLREAGAAEADLVIAATESDEFNMLCAVTASRLGAGSTVARVRSPEYLSSREFLSSSLGINLVVNPEYECAAEISRILRFPGAEHVDTFADSRIELAEFRVSEDSILNGAALKDLPGLVHARVLIGIVERAGKASVPNGGFTLQAGDRITAAGVPREMRRFSIAAGLYRKPVKRAMLMGGSRIAVYLARTMLENGVKVTVIERDRARCDALCDLIPGADIICGDATYTDLLLEEGIADMDAFVSLSGEDGYNMVASLFARSCKVPSVITKIDRGQLSDILGLSGLDTIITAVDPAVQQITRYARAMGNSIGSSMETLYRLADGQAEALEFLVKDGASCAGVPLRSMKLRSGILICAITRGEKSFIPGGDDEILSGDRVIVITAAGRLAELDGILESKEA